MEKDAIRWLVFSLFILGCLEGGEIRTKYFIAIRQTGTEDLSCYIPFFAPPGKYYADPFLFRYQRVDYLFFEDYDYQKGVISYVPLGAEGPLGKPQVALELPIHLSFPFLFQEGEEIYMVPETYRYRSVSLFRCLHFPDQWEKQRVLVKGNLFSDPILFQHEGLYWLFTAVERDRLAIFYASDLQSPFHPHPINRRRVRGRNAGPVFYHEGKLIRPTMDCRQRYGRAVILKEIVLLTKKEFIEKELATIEPNWAPNLVGTHTYCLQHDRLVYDGEWLISEEETEGEEGTPLLEVSVGQTQHF